MCKQNKTKQNSMIVQLCNYAIMQLCKMQKQTKKPPKMKKFQKKKKSKKNKCLFYSRHNTHKPKH